MEDENYKRLIEIIDTRIEYIKKYWDWEGVTKTTAISECENFKRIAHKAWNYEEYEKEIERLMKEYKDPFEKPKSDDVKLVKRERIRNERIKRVRIKPSNGTLFNS